MEEIEEYEVHRRFQVFCWKESGFVGRNQVCWKESGFVGRNQVLLVVL
jgi:hypothetical protein